MKELGVPVSVGIRHNIKEQIRSRLDLPIQVQLSCRDQILLPLVFIDSNIGEVIFHQCFFGDDLDNENVW